MSEWSLSLDFGTSNTTASYRIGRDEPRPVQLTSEGFQMPSAVLVTHGQVKVGLEAVRTQQLAPEGFVEAPKLLLGHDTTLLGGHEIPVPDLVAWVLQAAARRAIRTAGGTRPARVVLTHPYDFARPRREALLEAWARTGIRAGSVSLVSEPLAALAYYTHGNPAPRGRVLAVLDVGGGTCDIAVTRATGDPREPYVVIGHNGHDALAGRAVDGLLLTHVLAQLHSLGRSSLAEALTYPDGPVGLAAHRNLVDQIRQAKHALADTEDAVIVVGGLGPVDGRDAEAATTLTLTYSELAAIAEPVTSEIRNLTLRTLADAGVDAHTLHHLYLTGGSSLLRPLAHTIEELLGGRPGTRDNPKTVVTLGAHYTLDRTESRRPIAAAGQSPTQQPVSRDPATLAPPPIQARASGSAPPSLASAGRLGGSRPLSVAGGVSALLLVVAAVITVVVLSNRSSDTPRGPIATGTSTPTSVTTPSATAGTDSYDQLLDHVAVDPSECSPALVFGGTQGARCETTTEFEDQTFPLVVEYVLVDDGAAVSETFGDTIGDLEPGDCAIGYGVSDWTLSGDPADLVLGQIACFLDGSQDLGHNVLAWTIDADGVVGKVFDPTSAASRQALYAWWGDWRLPA
ncbi:hypothetical protein NOCA2150137 [metagenome]|uniref:Hsp70 protein n=1 Tax=metagenome TaxID=256318 RepID=A0A2P2BXB1_9ZZZZ